MVFYIEVCEFGFMMNYLLDNINVYVIIVVNFRELFYVCYYDEKRFMYLGDWYSVNWMEDLDVEDLIKEILYKQYYLVKLYINISYVMQYGNKIIFIMKVMQFQGMKCKVSFFVFLFLVIYFDFIFSFDVFFIIMKRKLMNINDLEEFRQFMEEIQWYLDVRYFIEKLVCKIVFLLVVFEVEVEQFLFERVLFMGYSCYLEVLLYFWIYCFNWYFFMYEYVLRYLYVLVNFCEKLYLFYRIKLFMDYVCFGYY